MTSTHPISRWRWPVLALLLAATLVGAAQLAFLCDDAFITFRYVANAHDGHGLVWNRAPFAPVEGYTGFLWALLLWAAWSWFGAEPPAIANALSMAFGVLQFAVLAAAALRLRRRDGSRAGDAVGLCALSVIVANRSFLQWFTGGLETALFNLGFVAWVALAFARATSGGWLAMWSTAATVAALTRPDGLLLVAATLATATVLWRRRLLAPRALFAGLLPFAAVAAHVLWRRCYYGDWLPNTYYAKVVDPWPEAGVRYAACFALEHGTWLVAGLALVWIVVEHVREKTFLLRAAREHGPALAAVGVCSVHAGYYVLRVGGDHFEYRVFSQWVPLLVLATAAMALRLAPGARGVLLTLLALLVASSAGWVHFALTRDMPDGGFQRLAPRVPSLLQPIARWYDRQQAWLLFQNVGVRCQHHARLLRDVFLVNTPQRVRITDPPDPFPVLAAEGVGVVGWSLPDCAIIDQHGLNDWVVARTPVHLGGQVPTDEAREQYRAFLDQRIDAADSNKDGWLDGEEIRKELGRLGGGDGKSDSGDGKKDSGDYFVAILLAVFAHDRFDALTRDEAAHVGEWLVHVRAMAHERHPPPGYVEAFAPNVVAKRVVERDVEHVVVRAVPRQQPLTAERIRAIEAEWRERARAGTLLK